MDLKGKMDRYNKRWNIINNESHEENFNKFKIRILNILKDIDSRVTEDSVKLFCQLYGIPEVWKRDPYMNSKWSKNIIDRLVEENNEIEFYKLIEVIFSLTIPGLSGYGSNVYSKSTIHNEVIEAINFSNVNVATTITDGGEIIFYPKGEEVLDQELVNNILLFLKEKSNKHFVEALNFYQDKNYIKSAESIRRCLEEFLREIFQNTKGLKANTSLIQDRLKELGNHTNIRNIIGNIFNYLDKYFNDESKHNDGELGDEENEFLIYQSALLMRYISKIIK